MHTIEGTIYAALSECFKEPSEEFVDDIASGRLEEVIKEGLSQLNIPVPGEMLMSLHLTKEHGFKDDIISVYEKLKADYHSLFFPLYVVPVESVYKEWSKTDEVSGAMKGEKGFIMGDPAVEMINRYRMAGIEIPQTYKDTPDHIALLLEYVSLLCDHAEKEDRTGFVLSHLDWVDDLRNDIYKYSESSFYRYVADITVAFIHYERKNLMSMSRVGITTLPVHEEVTYD